MDISAFLANRPMTTVYFDLEILKLDRGVKRSRCRRTVGAIPPPSPPPCPRPLQGR
ncbi:MAG: hypothetical protein METHAR1v1_120011 [Methanothrix sp.]|nr:MAG: hypothetical protein METHAR1v1_120011 [Methanothrix sp.]